MMTWERRTEPFERTLGKYQVEKAIELCKGPKILDLGCGDGMITKELCDHFDYVVGVDASREQIELARKKAKKAIFYVSSIEDFDPSERFDSILLFQILEHLNDLINVLKRIKEWLNEDGYIVIQVPNALSLNRRIGKIMGLINDCYELTPYDIKVGHKRFYDLDLLKKDVSASGLKIKQCGRIFLKPLSNPQMEWLCNCELWNSGERGWGGDDSSISWSERYCDALYAIGKELPEYCMVIYAQCVVVE